MKIQPTTLLPGRRGFTLPEVLIVMGITTILATVVFMLSARMKEKANRIVCMSKMKQIGNALIARASDNNDRMYTAEEIGNSSYRQYRDPLSLCQVLKDYISGENVWISPGAHKRALPFKNSYAWSRSANVTTKRTAEVAKPHGTVMLWNNHTFTLPSVYNVPEGSNGGPRNASSQYYYYPWDNHSALNWLYMDGHVETW